MSEVIKTALSRLEGAIQLPDDASAWAVDNLSTEDLYISMATGRVAEAAGIRVPGKTTFESGKIEPAPLRKVYYSARQPGVLLRIRTGKDAEHKPCCMTVPCGCNDAS